MQFKSVNCLDLSIRVGIRYVHRSESISLTWTDKEKRTFRMTLTSAFRQPANWEDLILLANLSYL